MGSSLTSFNAKLMDTGPVVKPAMYRLYATVIRALPMNRHPSKWIQSPWVFIALGAILVVLGTSVIVTRPADLGPGSVALSSDSPAPIPSLLSAFPSTTPGPTPDPSATETPSFTIAPTPTSTPVTHTVTRIVFSRARVDLPVITAPTNEKFPYCDVAERMSYYGVPGAGGVTYLYAHATHYMFGGLLAASWQPDSYLMGQQIQIYTSDDLVYTYAVTAIDRHQSYKSFAVADTIVGETLILQTCENNDATGTKLLVIARPVKVASASHTDAHPPTTARVCAHGY